MSIHNVPGKANYFLSFINGINSAWQNQDLVEVYTISKKEIMQEKTPKISVMSMSYLENWV
jgi:hypothetical protein